MERKPPQDIDAEQAVIGSLLLDNSRFDDIAFLRPEDFYQSGHRTIYKAIVQLLGANQPADLVTVFDELGTDIDFVGGAGYLAQLTDKTPTAANAEHYAQIVKDKSIMRGVIEVANKASYYAYQGDKSPTELVEDLTSKLTNIVDVSGSGVPDITNQLVKTITEIHERKPGQLLGISTGIPELDAWTSGLERGKLSILAARPSMGKTSLGLQIATVAATRADKVVAIFSLEMVYQSCIQKIIANHCFIPSSKIRQGLLAPKDIKRINEFASYLSHKKIVIDDCSRLTTSDLLYKCRKIKKKYGQLDLVVLDYIGKMTGKGDTRQQQIGQISGGLKELAKDLDCSVLALSQLNRGVEGRDNKRPMMSDLRESGDIEQDADLIMFLYRDEYYKPDTDKKGIAEIIIAKQREGKTGTIETVWIAETQKFMPIERGA